MFDTTDVVVFVCVVNIAIYFLQNEHGAEVVRVKSEVDSRWYVVRNLKNYQQAADTLARVNVALQKTIRALERIRGKEDKDVQRLRDRYDPASISESTMESRYYTSYSVNKGEKIVLCVRSREDENRLANENTLMYVALHELTHVMTDEVGHTPRFWKNFKDVLAAAIEEGLYKPVDYREHPEEYCGIRLQNSVLWGG